MQENCLTRLRLAGEDSDRLELRIPQPKVGSAAYALIRNTHGELTNRPVSAPGPSDPGIEGELVGYLWLAGRESEAAGTCVLVAHDPRMVVGGMAPPLPAVVLDPGTLLSFGGDLCHFAVRWTPEVSRPPEHLLKKPCPVCGCPLEAAPAVQCLCGRWTHLQNPDVPDDPEALNCFLHAEKCQCQRKSSLAPLVEPELPESLASGNSQDEW